MKKNLSIALLFIALTAIVTFLIGPEGGLPGELGSAVGQFLSRQFYFLFLALGIGYTVFSPVEQNEPRWSRVCVVLAIVLSCLIIEQTLDHFIWEPRPGWKNIVGKSSGFPSGHAIAAFALASLVSWLRPRWAFFMFGCAFLVAYARVEVMAHYPHQVVVGALIGVLIGFWVMGFRRNWLENRKNSLARSQPS